MTDDRNLTSHTYHENVAKAIFDKLPEYSKLMNTIHLRLSDKIK